MMVVLLVNNNLLLLILEIKNTFLDFSESFVQGVLAVSGDVLVDFGFVDVS
jgi:hypothetical protein